MITVEFKDGSLYMQIYERLRQEIESGRLKSGDKLPSKRALASHLGVSVNTVDAAYGQLLSEGFISARQRSGFYVLPIDALLKLGRAEGVPDLAPELIKNEQKTEFDIDFSPTGFAADKFPAAHWARLFRNVIDSPDALRRSPAQGSEVLREAISAYLFQARGFLAAPESIVIGPGSDSLLGMLSFIMERPVTLAVENPVYNKAYRLFEAMGHEVLAVDVDHDGIDTKPIENLDGVIAYTTPSHQYPLGESMPIARRIKLLNWAAAGTFRYIIEDDYDSEFRYGTKPIPALRSIDEADKVIYLGTFSRSVAPALRIGYMVLPKGLLELYNKRCDGFPSAVSALDQEVLARFITGGYFEKSLNRMRVYYKNKRKLLIQCLEPLSGKIRIVGDDAGHHLTVKLLTGLSTEQICEKAAEESVRVYALEPYFIGKMDKKYEGKFLVGFGGLSDEQIIEGAARLVRALS